MNTNDRTTGRSPARYPQTTRVGGRNGMAALLRAVRERVSVSLAALADGLAADMNAAFGVRRQPVPVRVRVGTDELARRRRRDVW